MEKQRYIIGPDAPILVTGSTGFIGSRLVQRLLDLGFRNLRCFVRPSSDAGKVQALAHQRRYGAQVEVSTGNLLSPSDCEAATKDVTVIFHLAAARGEKSFPDAFMNSVVTTRNLLDACLGEKSLRRFVNISSFSVYSNVQNTKSRLLDETSPLETRPELRGDPYCFAKVKQDELIIEYALKYGLPYVIVRPGHVYGPGNEGITARVGIGTFGVFLHLGGPNTLPLTYVDNCANAIALAGVGVGASGEVFNVVDDDLPSSRTFLRLYKENVQRFRSFYVPHGLSYALCSMWESYSNWSEGQLPLVFNRRRWHATWKKTHYSNAKLKQQLGWCPEVSTREGLRLFFEACQKTQRYA